MSHRAAPAITHVAAAATPMATSAVPNERRSTILKSSNCSFGTMPTALLALNSCVSWRKVGHHAAGEMMRPSRSRSKTGTRPLGAARQVHHA